MGWLFGRGKDKEDKEEDAARIDYNGTTELEKVRDEFKELLKNTDIKFVIHAIDTINFTEFFIEFIFSPLSQMPYGPEIPFWVQNSYMIYRVSVHIERARGNEFVVTIHFKKWPPWIGHEKVNKNGKEKDRSNEIGICK